MREAKAYGVVDADVDAGDVEGGIGDIDDAGEVGGPAGERRQRQPEHPVPLDSEGIEQAKLIAVQRIIGDGRCKLEPSDRHPVSAEVHDLTHADEVLLRCEITGLSPRDDRFLVVVGLLPVGRRPRLRDGADGRCRVGRLVEVADDEPDVAIVVVVVHESA